MKEDKYKSFYAHTEDDKEIVIALPCSMTAKAANEYIQYMRNAFKFAPLRLNKSSWTQIMEM